MIRTAFFFLAILISTAIAEEKNGKSIWSALVLATKENPPAALPPPIEPYAIQLKKTFGYNSFYLLGQKTRPLDSGEPEWLVPSKELYLRVRPQESTPTGELLQIAIFQKKSLLVESDARLVPNSPLFIRGPLWGKGQLIVILRLLTNQTP